jgi:prepilin-type N-terminal cleavage/methylation domain-containing protein
MRHYRRGFTPLEIAVNGRKRKFLTGPVRKISNRAGFTLIELIIVIVIISILAAVAVPIISGMKAKAICAEAVTVMGTVRNALRAYYVENNGYSNSWWGGQVSYMSDDDIRAYLPGMTRESFQGTYFDDDCYYVSSPLGWEGCVYALTDPESWGWGVNSAPRGDETKLIDDGDWSGYIYMYVGSGKIYQYGVSKSGYHSKW